MTPAEIREKILSDSKFVISELKKVQVLYKLKKIIRYNHERTTESHTESVAEHIFALHNLIDYFLPLEDKKEEWDKLKIHEIAQYHDIDEIETGDTIAFQKIGKIEEFKNTEQESARNVVRQIPVLMQKHVNELLLEYYQQETVESRFLKAIDKIEPVFHMYCDNGKKWLKEVKGTRDMHEKTKIKYVEAFPVLKRFNEVMADQYEKEDFYYKES